MNTRVIIDILKNQKSTSGIVEITNELADDIISKLDNYTTCRNELCLICGKYKEEHNGWCDGCRFKDI